MTRRMLTALVALFGLFVALYLALYKAGVIGTLACGAGSCETVQQSRWATFLGLPVAAWGVGYYALVFALAVAGVQDRWAESRGLSLGLLVLTGWGVLFSAWLTYLELFVINAICRWCVVSAVIALVLFVLAIWDFKAGGRVEVIGDTTPPNT
ncbi:MAG: vitamin K epoxide reductase family protein [Gemmatimonadaceae bacterium]